MGRILEPENPGSLAVRGTRRDMHSSEGGLLSRRSRESSTGAGARHPRRHRRGFVGVKWCHSSCVAEVSGELG